MRAKRPCTTCGKALRKSNVTGFCGACLPAARPDRMRELANRKHSRDRENAERLEIIREAIRVLGSQHGAYALESTLDRVRRALVGIDWQA